MTAPDRAEMELIAARVIANYRHGGAPQGIDFRIAAAVVAALIERVNES